MAQFRPMRIACHTQDEIGEAVGVTRQAVAVWEDEFAKNLDREGFANSRDFVENLDSEESLKWHNFDPPIYNVWKQIFSKVQRLKN